MRRHLPPEPFSQAALWSRRLGLFAAVVAALEVVNAPSTAGKSAARMKKESDVPAFLREEKTTLAA